MILQVQNQNLKATAAITRRGRHDLENEIDLDLVSDERSAQLTTNTLDTVDKDPTIGPSSIEGAGDEQITLQPTTNNDEKLRVFVFT